MLDRPIGRYRSNLKQSNLQKALQDHSQNFFRTTVGKVPTYHRIALPSGTSNSRSVHVLKILARSIYNNLHTDMNVLALRKSRSTSNLRRKDRQRILLVP